MDNRKKVCLGIDIGGSHITAGEVDLVQKKVIDSSVVRRMVDRHAPAAEILAVWADTINGRLHQYQLHAATIGFAMPGPFDYPNGVCLIKGFDKYEALYNMNIREELAARTRVPRENFFFRNDADASLEGELFAGAGQGYTRALGITLGTGLGSCFYREGEISDAGLNVLPFKNGMAEEYLSTRWFVKAYEQYTGKAISGVKELTDRYNDDDQARLVFDEFSANFGEVLLHCRQAFDVDVVIIGGNISNAYPLFIDQLLKQLPAGGPVIRKAILGEQAALIGAVVNCNQNATSA